MKPTPILLTVLLLPPLGAIHAAAHDLSKVISRADLDSVIAATTHAALNGVVADDCAQVIRIFSRASWLD